jgi:hypothetical protein
MGTEALDVAAAGVAGSCSTEAASPAGGLVAVRLRLVGTGLMVLAVASFVLAAYRPGRTFEQYGPDVLRFGESRGQC